MRPIRFVFLVLFSTVLLGCAAPGPLPEPPSAQAMERVQPGMSTAEVEQLLGRPDGGMATYGAGETVSGWRVPVRGHGIRAAYFNVHFRDGKVVRTSRSADYFGG